MNNKDDREIELAIALGAYEDYKGCYLIRKSDKEYTLFIPDSREKAPSKILSEPLYKGCNLKVIGGRNLYTTESMFRECQAESLDLSSFNTSSVTVMDRMFENCKARCIDFSSFDTSKVEYMNSMFCDCKAESLDLSSFNTSKVVCMSYMFTRCEAKSIDLSSFDTSNVEDMDGMFAYCRSNILISDRF